VNRVLKKK